MTGYGKSTATFSDKKIHVEIKSLNSKAMDLSTRIAPLYRAKEMEIRAMIASSLERGKVDFCLWIEKENNAATSQINLEMAQSYHRQLQELTGSLGWDFYPNEYSLSLLLRMPDIMSKDDTQEVGDEEWNVTRAAIEEALEQLTNFRKQEGAALQRKFCEKLDNIARLLQSIEPYEKERVEKIRQRITEALEKSLSIDYDKNRLEQELIYYIEKLDINEEKQRLANHLRYFRETMESGHGQGKKLGFIAQEMGREINTTGSKSNHAEMQNIVVQMKDELEQIKEQVLNVM